MCDPLISWKCVKIGLSRTNGVSFIYVLCIRVLCIGLFHVYLCVLPSGPFPSNDMKEWFDEGYFTLDLMVRRACDELMLPLGAFCKPVV